METKRKRGRPKKVQLPEEIQRVIDDIKEKEEEEIKQVVDQVKKEHKQATEWDVPSDEPIKYFDKRLSYELTGYKPITETQGLDFKPEWFTVARDTYMRTGSYCQYPFRSKAYNDFWHEEYVRCRDGYTVNGYTITGPNYYYLNYYQLPNIDVEKAGSGRAAIFPRFLVFQYEFFHYFEICRILKKDVCLMKARGIGFSEINAAICACIYNVFRDSRCMITASSKNYVDKSLDKAWNALTYANDCTQGGMFKLRQVHDTQYYKKASWYENQNGQNVEVGWKSSIEGIVADNDSKIRGDRVDLLVYEEAGSNPTLRKSYIKGQALIYIGGTKFGIRLVGGTGGDSGPNLEGLSNMYYSPESYDILPFYHNYTPDKNWVKTGYFIPSYIGAVVSVGKGVDEIERQLLDERGYCIWQNYKAQIDAERAVKTDPKALLDFCAEYCYTAEEAFALEGENKFNKVLIAEQLMKIRALKMGPKKETGILRFKYTPGNHTRDGIIGASWQPAMNGPIKIIEHPLWECEPRKDENGQIIWNPPTEPINNLYVAGVDGIDLGKQDTSDYTKDPSDFCMVILKRQYGLQEPQIVAIYKDRPNDIREAHETAIKLALYYNCVINIEASRISLIGYARQNRWLNYFMKRPSITYPDATKKFRSSAAYGTPATVANIEHHTDLLRDFINDYCQNIWFEELLDEANRYSDEQKRKFDIIAATGMALMADEELGSVIPKKVKSEDDKFVDFGYYYDENGVKRYGVIPNKPKFTTNADLTFRPYGYDLRTDPRYRDYGDRNPMSDSGTL